MKRLVPLLVLAAFSCKECESTYNGAKRREAEARIASCKRTTQPAFVQDCYVQAWAFCSDAGLEKTCGEGGGWGTWRSP